MPIATSRCVVSRTCAGGWVRLAAAAALALTGTGQVSAGDNAQGKADAAASQDLSSITSLDEVVVTGKLDTLSGIRDAIKDAENRFYARYNELNKDRDYDVMCRREAPTGSRVARDICQAQVVDEVSSEQARDFVAGTANARLTPMTVLVGSAAAEMRQRALALLKSDPELMHDLLEHARLEQMYQDMVHKQFKGWPGVR